MSRTQARILEHLKRRKEASVAELSRNLGLTSVTIRHHLAAMMAQGLVLVTGRRMRPGPGRPETCYGLARLADARLPRNYPEMCEHLVLAMGTKSQMEKACLLEEAGRSLGGRLGGDLPGAPQARWSALEAALSERGYMASCMESNGELAVTLANCPYLEIARSDRSLCQFDMAFLQMLSGKALLFQQRIIDGAPACVLRG